MLMTFVRNTALAMVFAAAAAAPALAQMQPEERSVLRSEVRAYLLEHPEVLMEALQILETRRREAAEAAALTMVSDNADEIFNDGYSFVGGNPDGDITMVEFLDYNCAYCKKAHDGVNSLLQLDPNIRFVIKEFPILGPTSRTAAQAAMAALRQDDGRKYLAFSNAMMNNRGTLTEDQIWSYAEASGLDLARLREDAERPEIEAMLQQTYELARKLEVNGTPAFVIGDQMVRGYIPLEQLMQKVAEARQSLN
jgi:protein-disulfide isomerase